MAVADNLDVSAKEITSRGRARVARFPVTLRVTLPIRDRELIVEPLCYQGLI